jgi:hypothetical protein
MKVSRFQTPSIETGLPIWLQVNTFIFVLNLRLDGLEHGQFGRFFKVYHRKVLNTQSQIIFASILFQWILWYGLSKGFQNLLPFKIQCGVHLGTLERIIVK